MLQYTVQRGGAARREPGRKRRTLVPSLDAPRGRMDTFTSQRSDPSAMLPSLTPRKRTCQQRLSAAERARALRSRRRRAARCWRPSRGRAAHAAHEHGARAVDQQRGEARQAADLGAVGGGFAAGAQIGF